MPGGGSRRGVWTDCEGNTELRDLLLTIVGLEALSMLHRRHQGEATHVLSHDLGIPR